MATSNTVLDLTKDLRELTLMATRPQDVDHLLSRALEFLKGIVPYDLAAVLELSGDRLRVRCARGPLATQQVKDHGISLSDFPSVRLALETRRTRVLEEDDHQGEGDPYDGVLDLPDGHACMVVPLFSNDRTLGAMTFDRRQCGAYEETVVNLATIYGQIISLAMVAAEQAALLARRSAELKAENQRLLAEVNGRSSSIEMLAHSQTPEMQRIVQMGQQVAETRAPVLILGETGTGKEILARAIHEWSDRRALPFVKINCAALPENLVESELFGHTKGAFSGAERDRSGRFAAANGGTILLDEIGDLPLSAQAKLLRVLQEGTLEPVGSDRTIKVDVRMIAATHVNLEEAIEHGRFREDLFYRLNVFPLELPQLRARAADIIPIAISHLEATARRTGRGPWTLSKETIERFRGYDWPGNVRELINALDRATILASEGELNVALLKRARRGESLEPHGDPSSWPSLMDVERRYIERVLRATDGKIYGSGGAAEIVGLKPSTLQSRMTKLGVSKHAEHKRHPER